MKLKMLKKYSERRPTLDALRALNGFSIGDLRYRWFLDAVSVGDYVEAHSTEQCGNVVEIIRSQRGVPVCLMVDSGEQGVDYISADRVCFWEQYQWVDSYKELCGSVAIYSSEEVMTDGMCVVEIVTEWEDGE